MKIKMKYVAFFVLNFLPPFALAGPLCALSPGGYANHADQPASPMAADQMSHTNNVLCSRFPCPSYQFFKNHTAGNAQAYLDQFGAQIRYNPQFMNQVLQSFGPQATIGILAHELGHIIDFANNPSQQSQYQREAAADEYAGCAFALAGAPPQALSALQQTLFSMGSSPGYPNSHQRAALIQSGYNKCLN
ncbi:hypothetical protein KFE80_00385 [bacterium SCSIO 12696]|nr:hypothetical protein KFE80_00385 [bacterium SCSIO 12696]